MVIGPNNLEQECLDPEDFLQKQAHLMVAMIVNVYVYGVIMD